MSELRSTDLASLKARVFDGAGWNKAFVEGALIHDLWAEVERLSARVKELEAGHFNAMLHLRFDDPEGAQTSLRDSLRS